MSTKARRRRVLGLAPGPQAPVVGGGGPPAGYFTSDAWISAGSGAALQRSANANIQNDESAVYLSAWIMGSNWGSTDQCFFEFWNSTSDIWYKFWWDVSLKSFIVDFENNIGSDSQIVYAATLLPAALLNVDVPVVDTWFHVGLTLHGTTIPFMVNNVNEGNGTGGGTPSTSAATTLKAYVGRDRAGADPVISGGGVCQLRWHKGWTDRGAFINADPSVWDRRIVPANETALWRAWEFEGDATEETGAGPDFTLQTGAFTTEGGPDLQDPV